MKREAAKVKEELEQQAQSLFERKPLGWDLKTIHYLYEGALSLPGKVPELTSYIIKQSRLMGSIGSLLVSIFLMALIYTLLVQRRAFRWVEKKALPLREPIPQVYYPYFQSGSGSCYLSLMPLILLGLFSIIKALVVYQAAWFELLGRLLGLWVAGALIFQLLKESLKNRPFPGHGPIRKNTVSLGPIGPVLCAHRDRRILGGGGLSGTGRCSVTNQNRCVPYPSLSFSFNCF